ncbi:MAG: vitamin K epoxide reductase family protein [Chloroflexi bacterium]|nr:vitamin K epoxide reductase family protein [Chloroflexota bacterium]
MMTAPPPAIVDRSPAWFRSQRSARLLALPLLSAAGLGVSAYLTYVRLAHGAPLCGTGGCETVNASAYAAVGQVPIAVLGLLLYGLVLVLSLAALRGPLSLAPWMLLGVFGLTASGTLYSAYLTAIELFVLEAICPWCVTSAAIVTVICVVSAWTLLRPPAGLLGERR